VGKEIFEFLDFLLVVVHLLKNHFFVVRFVGPLQSIKRGPFREVLIILLLFILLVESRISVLVAIVFKL
jgi:hypothetical protein